jgi:hypothetical protein
VIAENVNLGEWTGYFTDWDSSYTRQWNLANEVRIATEAIIGPLTLVICFYYMCMVNTLRQFTDLRLPEQKAQLNRFFFWVMITYSIRIIYTGFFTEYWHIVCQSLLRKVLAFWIEFLLQCLAIIPMLVLHSRAFSEKTTLGKRGLVMAGRHSAGSKFVRETE